MNAPPVLNRLQHAIVSLLFDCVDLRDPVTPLEFKLSGDFQGAFNAVVGIPDNADEEVMVVASLPRYTKTVFVGLTRRGELDVARLLANLEDLERESAKPLKLGEVIGHQGDSAASTHAPFATILMPIATAAILRPLPPVTTVDDENVRFVLALPLTQRELECRNTRGHDAMIDMFQREGKSLFFQ